MKTSCTIIVYHYEAMPFLRACIRKIREYCHENINQHIIITEQSCEGTRNQVISEFGASEDITIVPMKPLWSGYAIDYVMRFCDIKTDYVCGIEPDVFPIHENWLYLCIKLIEENDFKFVGCLLTETSPEIDYKYYFYNDKKNPFLWISQCLRVGRTIDYRELAMEGGFTRFHSMKELEISGEMTWGNDDWAKWASEDYYARGSDDATVAHCWEDNHREHNKFTFGITHIMGIPPESGYGRIIDGIVFHFGFHRTSVGVENAMGGKYCEWKERINNGCDNNLIQEMIDYATKYPTLANDRRRWDGKLKKSFAPSEELHKRIEELKNK